MIQFLVWPIYYPIALLICVFVILFWLLRLTMTVVVMVFALLLEAWRNKAPSNWPYEVINQVAEVGPKTVSVLLRAPLRRGEESIGVDDGRSLVFEVVYTLLFLASLAAIIFFRGFLESFGEAVAIPQEVFADNGPAAKLGVAYVALSFIVTSYLILTTGERRGAFWGFVVPIYLILTGMVLIYSGYIAWWLRLSA